MFNDILEIKIKKKQEGITQWKYWTYFGIISAFAFWLIAMFIMIKKPFDAYNIPWSPKGQFSSALHILFIVIPFVGFGFIFGYRHKLAKSSKALCQITMLIFGSLALYWELAYDVTTIIDQYRHDWKHRAMSYWVFYQFIQGFDFCRLMLYTVGTFMILKQYNLLKLVVATAMFGGLSTLFNTYDGIVPLHTIIGHSIILALLPTIVIAMNKTNYRVQDLIHAHLLNWTFLLLMISVNLGINGSWVSNDNKYGFSSIAGELTKDRMANNIITKWAGWPGSIVVWIIIVMIFEFIYFSIHRLVFWKAFDKEGTFRETFIVEHNESAKSWYGFKIWGSSSLWKKFKSYWPF